MRQRRRLGVRPAGIREVAASAGVAISSVSRVLSGHKEVSPEMRDAVMAAVAELRYQPDMVARGLRSRKTLSIGYVVSNISNPILADIVTGAEARLRAAGFSLLLTNSEGNPELDVTNIALLRRRRVDGLLLSLTREDFRGLRAVLEDIDIPFVLVDRDSPTGVRAWTVGFDHRVGLAAATRHLVDLGHRNFAVIVGGPRRPARERQKGVTETLTGVRGSQCKVFDGDFSIAHGVSATRQILSLRPMPTALIAGGNLMMHGALRVLHERGLQVGTGISFVGCDDVGLAEFHSPQISVVRRDTRALGMVAAETLLAILEAHQAPAEQLLPTEFIARPSCAPPPNRE